MDCEAEDGGDKDSKEEPSCGVFRLSDGDYAFGVHVCGGLEMFKRHTSVDTIVSGNCGVEGFLASVVRFTGFINLPANEVVECNKEVLADPAALLFGDVLN